MVYTHISTEQRYNLGYLLNLRHPPTINEIAKSFNKHRTTIWRERKRNMSNGKYQIGVANFLTKERRLQANSNLRKIETNIKLETYIINQLKNHWSPDQIAHRWNMETDNSYHISYPTIYKYIYQHRELWCYLRHKKNKFRHRYGTNIRIKARENISSKKSIDQRPWYINQRIRIGDFEGDTMILNPRTSCLLTYTDRKSKYELIHFSESRNKESIRNKTNELFKDIPNTKLKSFTYDNGGEFTDYEMIEKDLNIDIYHAHPYASYERGTNENTNGLIREFFPKKEKYDTMVEDKVKAVQDLLNHRPRKSLNYLMPYEVFHDTRCCTLDLN